MCNTIDHSAIGTAPSVWTRVTRVQIVDTIMKTSNIEFCSTYSYGKKIAFVIKTSSKYCKPY